MENKGTEQLLEQILEVERAHLEEYKRVTSQSLEMQRRAVDSQLGYLRILKPIVVIGVGVVAVLIVYLLWLSRYVR
jgi:hypothetical protein